MSNDMRNIINNLKYWVIGNIITAFLAFGIFIMLLSINQLNYSMIIICTIYITPFFLGGLIIKCIKLDMPIYYYSTVGVIYHISLFFIMVDGKEISFSDSFNYLFWIILLCIVIVSMIGGSIVEFIKYKKYC